MGNSTCGVLACRDDFLIAKAAAIPGWIDPMDVALLARISYAERRVGVIGDVLEIGAYFGRTSVVLGSVLGEGEELVVNDLFDVMAPTGSNAREVEKYYSGDLTADGFKEVYVAYQGCVPEVIACPSSEVSERLMGREFRLIHVDGSHQFDVVTADIRTAVELLGDRGVVVFDDYRAAHTPGVAAAVWQAVSDDRVRPIMLSYMKLYAVEPQFQESWVDLLRGLVWPVGVRFERMCLFEYEVLRAFRSKSRVVVTSVG